MLVAFSLGAAPVKLDSLTVGSETYSNVTFLGANATDVYFTHSLGIANVNLLATNVMLGRKDGEAADITQRRLVARQALSGDARRPSRAPEPVP